MSLVDDYCQQHGVTVPEKRSIYRAIGKRLLDLVVSVPIALFISPALVVVSILIKCDSRGPVFFLQPRLGRWGKTFMTYKFRTMTDRVRTQHQEVLPGNSEVTRVGYWLRRFKIDELPQVWNVLNGDMSLVGPRPALPEAIHDYNQTGLKRLLERPGLTGQSQVNGNIYLSWPERWIYDAAYVEQLSLSGDLWILLKTVGVVLLGEEKFLNRPTAVEPPKVTQPEIETTRRAA